MPAPKQTPSGIKPANNQDLIRLLSKRTGYSLEVCKGLVHEFLGCITQLAKDTPYLKVREFGRFEYRHFSPRRNTSSLTGTTVQLPAREALCFTAAKGLKEEVAD